MTKRVVKVYLILWWCFIFGLTSIPGSSLPSVDVISVDKIVHLVMYGGLGFWLTIFFGKKGVSGLRLFLLVFVISVAYSFFDEWHQPFIGRTFSLLDVSANIIGMIITSLPLSIYYSRKRVTARAN